MIVHFIGQGMNVFGYCRTVDNVAPRQLERPFKNQPGLLDYFLF